MALSRGAAPLSLEQRPLMACDVRPHKSPDARRQA